MTNLQTLEFARAFGVIKADSKPRHWDTIAEMVEAFCEQIETVLDDQKPPVAFDRMAFDKAMEDAEIEQEEENEAEMEDEEDEDAEDELEEMVEQEREDDDGNNDIKI